MTKLFPFIIMVSIFNCNVLFAAQATANVTEIPVSKEFVFKDIPAIEAVVEEKRLMAKNTDKLLMLVFGGEWCHDSRGLAQRFSRPAFKEKLLDKYVIQFVDVGFVDKGFELIKQFGLPIYYGTPTVLIVDPSTSRLLNKADHQTWLSADSVSDEQYQTYFISQDYLALPSQLASNAQYQHYLAQIENFEQQQASKLYKGYQRVGPLLREYKLSGGKPSKVFIAEWTEVQKFRMNLANDIGKLLLQAKENVEQHSVTALPFKEYEKFSWQ